MREASANLAIRHLLWLWLAEVTMVEDSQHTYLFQFYPENRDLLGMSRRDGTGRDPGFKHFRRYQIIK